MQIFYINIDNFKKNHDKSFLLPFSDIEIKTEKRFYEYTLGRYLVKTIAREIYNIKNDEIILNSNGKPVFKSNEVFFSISHSNNIVIACFDQNNCAIDIEYEKERDLKKFSKYYKKNFKNLDEFYKFWTLKEAEYKLNSNASDKSYYKFENYHITVVSEKNINEKPYIIEYTK